MSWSRERLSIGAYFATMGFVCAAWVSSIPDLKDLLGLDHAQLGRLLVWGPVGTATSYTFVSSLVARIGSRRATLLGAAGQVLAAAALAAGFAVDAPYPYWCASLAFLGAFGNILNISANTQGGLAELRAGRSIMSGFHGLWSVANLTGAFIALVASSLMLPVQVRMGATLSLAAAFAVLGRGGLIPSDVRAGEKERTKWAWPGWELIGLGLIAMVFMGCEGSVYDWVGVFYRDVLRVPPQRVLWGYCAVMATMTVGRFSTDALVDRFSAVRVVRVYSLLAFSGLVVALWSPAFTGLSGLLLHVVVTAGYALAGFGVSGLVPIVYARTARVTTVSPGTAVTIVASLGFLGFFVGPPLIGAVSKGFGLSVALSVFAVLVLFGLLFGVGGRDSSSDRTGPPAAAFDRA